MRTSFNIERTVGVAICLAFAGCQQDSITVYEVPKEDYSPRPVQRAAAEPEAPHVHWELPKGWVEKPSEGMAVGRFQIAGEDGKTAEVRIVPLAGAATMPAVEEGTLDMWAKELNLPAGTNRSKAIQVEVGGMAGRLYDLTSAEPMLQGKFKSRITAAVLPHEGALWFIRLSGEESLVAAQQEPFREFLKSLSFHEEGAHAAASGGGKKLPAGWSQKQAGQMIKEAYSVRTSSGAVADITVTSFPGMSDMLALVNRWLGQVNAPATTAAELSKMTKTMQLASGEKATLFTTKGTGASGNAVSMQVLIVQRAGESWFYKMMGDEEAVAAETEHLAEFAGGGR